MCCYSVAPGSAAVTDGMWYISASIEIQTKWLMWTLQLGLSGPDSELGYWWSERELLYVSASVCGRKTHREAAFEKQPCRQQAFLPEFLLTHPWPSFLGSNA